MVRKNIKRIVFVAVFAAALILFVPFPQKIVQEYRGVDTVNGEKADITLDITYLRFLVLRNTMKTGQADFIRKIYDKIEKEQRHGI